MMVVSVRSYQNYIVRSVTRLWLAEAYNLVMGKFYVLIEVECKNYRVCRDDVSIIHSRRRTQRPPLPLFAFRRIPSEATNEGSDLEESSLQFEPLQLSTIDPSEQLLPHWSMCHICPSFPQAERTAGKQGRMRRGRLGEGGGWGSGDDDFDGG